MIVLDASVLIGQLDAHDVHHLRARKLLAEGGAGTLGASAITIAETLVAPARAGKLEPAVTALDRLGVIELDLGRNSARRLAELRVGTGLRLPDCCVLATALEHEAALASFDEALTRAARDLGLNAVS